MSDPLVQKAWGNMSEMKPVFFQLLVTRILTSFSNAAIRPKGGRSVIYMKYSNIGFGKSKSMKVVFFFFNLYHD